MKLSTIDSLTCQSLLASVEDSALLLAEDFLQLYIKDPFSGSMSLLAAAEKTLLYAPSEVVF